MKLFVLSKENLALAGMEAETLQGTSGTRSGPFLFLDVERVEQGLALTREIHEVLGDNLTLAWAEHVLSPFAVTSHCDVDEKEVAGLIWRSLEEKGEAPSVDLSQPQTAIHLFRIENRLVVTRLLWRNEEPFFDRRAHLRPRNHPTSLNPKLARAMVNLAGLDEELLDPFCGSGGILLEGALAKRKMTGIDLDPRQVARSEENLAHYGVSAMLSVGDATTCDQLGPFGAIVTDLPLGKNAKLTDAESTFRRFFEAAIKITNRMIVAIDASVELPFGSWKERARFDWYVHKGMVKRIFILER